MVDTASPLLSAACCSVRPRSLRALRSLAPTSCLPAGMAAAVRAPGSTAARTWSGVGRVLDLGLDLGLDLVRGLGMKRAIGAGDRPILGPGPPVSPPPGRPRPPPSGPCAPTP